MHTHSEGPGEDMVRRQLATGEAESPHGDLRWLASSSRTFSLQNCEKINFCCLRYPRYIIVVVVVMEA